MNGFEGLIGSTGITGIIGTIGFTYTGPEGLQGNNGVNGSSYTGPQGLTGLEGVIGEDGFTGSKGLSGPQGTTGSIGLSGLIGPIGSIGFTGPEYQGTKGPTGDIGTTGSLGLQGYNGLIGPKGPVGGTTLLYSGTNISITPSGTTFTYFSANYDVYLVKVTNERTGNYAPAAGSGILFRLANNGVVDSGVNYRGLYFNTFGATQDFGRQDTNHWGNLCFNNDQRIIDGGQCTIFNPFLPTYSINAMRSCGYYTAYFSTNYVSAHMVNSSYNGLNIYSFSGTNVINISIYGFNK